MNTKNAVAKKIFSLMLCCCMLLSMNSPAYATENGEAPACTEHAWVDGVCTACGAKESAPQPQCTGDEGCTLTEGHNEGCPKAAKTEPQPQCTGDENCTLTEGHNEGCPKAAKTGPQSQCTGDENCTLTEGHNEGCPKVVNAAEVLICDCEIKCTADAPNTECELCGNTSDFSLCTGKEPVDTSGCTGLGSCQSENHKEKCLSLCICEELCTSAEYRSDCPVCKKGDGFNLCQICTCVVHCTEANNGCNVCRVEHSACKGKCIKAEGCTAEQHDFNCPEASVKEKVKPRSSYSEVSAEELKNIFGDLGLQSGLSYATEDTVDDAINGGYGDWEAEFYLSFGGFDGTISLNGCAIAGMIGPFKQHIPVNDDSVILSPGSKIAIIDSLKQLAGGGWSSFNVTYSLVCEFSDDGTMFVCGIQINEELLKKHPNFRVTLDLVLNPPAGVDEEPLLLHSVNLNVSKLTGNGDVAAKIEGADGSVEYGTIEDALNNASDNATISLMDALECDSIKLEGKILDLNGYSFDGSVEGTVSVGGGTWTGNVCPESAESKSGFLFASDDGVFVSDGNVITAVTGGTVELLQDMDAASIQFGKDVDLTIAKDVSLTVTGQVELGTSKVSGDGKIVLMNPASTFRRLLKNTVITTELIVDEKLPEGTVVSGVEGMAVTCTAEGGKYVYRLASAAAKIGETPYASLQEAIDNVKNGETITLTAANSENVTVVQAPDVAFTIDGQNNTMSGTVTINGKSAAYATAGLTIKNINFDAAAISKDASINLGGNNNTRYISNLTVESCTFTDNDKTAVGIKSYTGGDKNLTVTGCTAAGMHSLLQVKNVANVTVSGCTVTGSKNGVSLGSSHDAVVSGCEISADGYGIRADANDNVTGSGAEISNCDVKANIPVVVRNATKSYDLGFSGSNNMTATNGEGLWCAVGIQEYGDVDKAGLSPATGNVAVSVSSTSLAEGVHGVVAMIDSTLYTSLNAANTASSSGDTIVLLEDVSFDTPIQLKDGVTLDLNGKSMVGTVMGNVSVNGGSWTTKDSHSYKMICSSTNANKDDYFYISDDGVFSANMHGALSMLSGTVTVSVNGRTVPGQTVTIADEATFIVPAGKEFEVLGTAIVDGTVVVDGTIILGSDVDTDHLNATKTASLTAPSGLNVVSGIDGYSVVYDGSKYTLAPASSAPIIATIGSANYSNLQAALDAAKDGDTVELKSDVANDVTVKSNITLDLNGNKVTGSVTVAQGKTLSMEAADLPVTVSGSVKIGSHAFTLSALAQLSTDAAGNLLITANDTCTLSIYGKAVDFSSTGTQPGSISIASSGTATLPEGCTVTLSSEYAAVILNGGAQLDKDGKLTVLPVNVTDENGDSVGYAISPMLQIKDGSLSRFAVLSPLHPEAGTPYKMTITLDSNGDPVYNCPDTKEAPIVDDKADGKDYLKFIKKDSYFYKYGLRNMTFVCNGFRDCLYDIVVDGKELDYRTDYVIDRGSTIVTLKNAFLRELALGKHTLTLTYLDGQSITAEFTVGETPATGDSGYGVFAFGMGLSFIAMLGLFFLLRKRVKG